LHNYGIDLEEIKTMLGKSPDNKTDRQKLNDMANGIKSSSGYTPYSEGNYESEGSAGKWVILLFVIVMFLLKIRQGYM
jgi:hypothetical protein